jgi:SAM-dependent methyltransferase
MNGYRDDLAYIHDAGFGDHARAAAAVVVEDLRRRRSGSGLIVDLGCGSGIVSQTLVQAGYQVHGIDLSPAMIALCRERIPEGRFEVGSILSAQIPQSIAIVLVGEICNYLFDETHSLDRLGDVFRRAFAALPPGGLLLLDAAEPGRVQGGGPTKSFVEADDWAVLVESEEIGDLLTRRITSFRRIGETFRRDREVHRLRLIPRAEMSRRLSDVGFEVEVVTAFGNRPLGKGWAGYLARKPG